MTVQAQAQHFRLACREVQVVAQGSFGPDLISIDGIGTASNDVAMEGIFHVVRGVLTMRRKEVGEVGLVLREERFGHIPSCTAVQKTRSELGMVGTERKLTVRYRGQSADLRTGRVCPPVPGVAEPEVWQHIQDRIRPMINDCDLDQHVFRVEFGVLDEHIEIAVLREDARIQQFELRLFAAPLRVHLDELLIGIGGVRVFVEGFHVGMAGCGVEIEVVLLDIFTVIALRSSQPKKTLFEDGVFPVPERKSEAEMLLSIADAEQAIFVPAIDAGARVVVREVVPGRSVGAVVFTHGAPSPITQIRPPLLPVGDMVARLDHTLLYFGHYSSSLNRNTPSRRRQNP